MAAEGRPRPGTQEGDRVYTISAEVWRYPGMAGWHFITVPTAISEEIRERLGNMQRGWGSVPVVVTVGTTTWKTSLFPDKETRGYLLPLKAEVRKRENIADGDTIRIVVGITE
jgi:hypothetical protein